MTRETFIQKQVIAGILDNNILDAEDMYAMHKRWNNRLDMIRWAIIIDTLNDIDI